MRYLGGKVVSIADDHRAGEMLMKVVYVFTHPETSKHTQVVRTSHRGRVNLLVGGGRLRVVCRS